MYYLRLGYGLYVVNNFNKSGDFWQQNFQYYVNLTIVHNIDKVNIGLVPQQWAAQWVRVSEMR